MEPSEQLIPTDNKFPVDLALKVDRSPGLHLSTIYGDLETILFNPRKTDNPLWAQVGFIWEELLTMAFKSALGVRPGEFRYDGVIGSPDGVCYDLGYIDEYKCTWKSAKKTIEDMWKWQAQTKGYCKMVGNGITTVRFRVLYINGYWDGNGPVYRDNYVVYEESEIEDNWIMLINHAKSRGWL